MITETNKIHLFKITGFVHQYIGMYETYEIAVCRFCARHGLELGDIQRTANGKVVGFLAKKAESDNPFWRYSIERQNPDF